MVLALLVVAAPNQPKAGCRGVHRVIAVDRHILRLILIYAGLETVFGLSLHDLESGPFDDAKSTFALLGTLTAKP